MADQQLQGSDCELERRLIVARALAAEHGAPLGFHDEEDQLDWDRKAQAMLRELDRVEIVPRSEAEALAEALERIASRSDGDVAHHDHAQRLARKRVDEYRSRHPKEMS